VDVGITVAIVSLRLASPEGVASSRHPGPRDEIAKDAKIHQGQDVGPKNSVDLFVVLWP
jgi:hypothetical protein